MTWGTSRHPQTCLSYPCRGLPQLYLFRSVWHHGYRRHTSFIKFTSARTSRLCLPSMRECISSLFLRSSSVINVSGLRLGIFFSHLATSPSSTAPLLQGPLFQTTLDSPIPTSEPASQPPAHIRLSNGSQSCRTSWPQGAKKERHQLNSTGNKTLCLLGSSPSPENTTAPHGMLQLSLGLLPPS